jgi:hypothetical protein
MAAYREIIMNFLKRTNFSVQVLSPPMKDIVERRAIERINTDWANKGIDPGPCMRFFQPCLDLATVAYSHIPIDAQVHITIFTMITMRIDDLGVSDEAMDSFQARLLTKTPQLDPVLDLLVDYLLRTSDYYPSYACKCTTLSTIAHTDATLYEKHNGEEILGHMALPYVRYKRFRTGLAEAYSFFIWDKFSFPDMSTYIQTTP